MTKELKTLLIIMIIDNTVTDLLLPLSILVFHFIRLLSQHFHKSSKKENKYSYKKTYPFSFKCPVSSLKSIHKFSCQLVKLKLIYFRPHYLFFFEISPGHDSKVPSNCSLNMQILLSGK